MYRRSKTQFRKGSCFKSKKHLHSLHLLIQNSNHESRICLVARLVFQTVSVYVFYSFGSVSKLVTLKLTNFLMTHFPRHTFSQLCWDVTNSNQTTHPLWPVNQTRLYNTKMGGTYTATPPKTKTSPEKCWLENDPFLLNWSLFRWHSLNPKNIEPKKNRNIEPLYSLSRNIEPQKIGGL